MFLRRFTPPRPGGSRGFREVLAMAEESAVGIPERKWFECESHDSRVTDSGFLTKWSCRFWLNIVLRLKKRFPIFAFSHFF